MKKYPKILLLSCIALVALTGLFLYGRYSTIKTVHIEKLKTETVALIQQKVATLLTAEDFKTTDLTGKAPSFQNFWNSIQSSQFLRIKIWNSDFTVLWSDLSDPIGKRFADNHEVEEALDGEVEFEIGQLSAESVSERQFQEVSEIYVPIEYPNQGIVGVVEIYQPAQVLNAEIQKEFRKTAIPVALFTLFGLIALAILIRFFVKPTKHEARL